MGAQGNGSSRALLRFAMLRRRGFALPKHFALALSLLVALLQVPAQAAPSDSAQIKKNFAQFLTALAARDAAASSSAVSSASSGEWQRDRALALRGTRDEVAAQSPGRRLVIFGLRHHAPTFLSREGSPQELLRNALGSGLTDPKTLAMIELGDVAVQGDRASGQLFASGLPSGFRAGFVREDGVWKLDLGATIEAAGRVVTKAAKASDATEDSVIAGLLMVTSGQRPTSQIWQPLARADAPGPKP
jgi:hypothetical protein